jgi:hypothetical protein
MAYKISFKSNNERDVIYFFYVFFWALFLAVEQI